MKRTDRLAAILTMLQASPSVRPRQITERFGIGLRTVYRDIRALEEGGIPIAGDSRTGYSLVEGFKLPPLMFSRAEGFAFLAAEKLVERFTDPGMRESYRSGVDKIRAVMRSDERQEMGTAYSHISALELMVPPGAVPPENCLQLLMESISAKRQAEIVYFVPSRGETTRRTVDPVGLYFSEQHWYLTAFCNERADYRTFRLGRIREVHPTDIPAAPGHPPLSAFLCRPEDEAGLQEVIIEVADTDFLMLGESRYRQGLISERVSDGRVELRFRVFSIEGFARWYLSFADIGRIVTPQALKTKVAELLERAIKR